MLGLTSPSADLPELTQENVEIHGENTFVNTTATPPNVANLDLNNIQGDILFVVLLLSLPVTRLTTITSLQSRDEEAQAKLHLLPYVRFRSLWYSDT